MFGKITNLVTTNAKVIQYAFPLHFGICIYNLIQNGVLLVQIQFIYVCACVCTQRCAISTPYMHLYVTKTMYRLMNCSLRPFDKKVIDSLA